MINLPQIIRTLLRQKLNTAIIIVSLAVGMACLNLIAIFIERELNTDGFHKDKDRIYALKCDYKNGIQIEEFSAFGQNAGEYIKNNFSQIEDFCRVSNGSVRKVLVNNDAYFDRPVIIQASKNFFEFFTYNLLMGNSKTVLETRKSLVISEGLAHKYFGSTNAVGRMINLDKESMMVTGIFRKPVDNSQFIFDMIRLIPEDWWSACYLKLKLFSSPKELERMLIVNKDKIPKIQLGIPGDFTGIYHLKSLSDDYFGNSFSPLLKKNTRHINDLRIAFIIGIVIMTIGTFNYLGLIYNNLLKKNKIYSIKMVHGGTKFGLVLNFINESFLMVLLSFFLSLVLMIYLAPFFNELTHTNITTEFIFRPKQILILFAIITLLLFITFLSLYLKIKTKVDIQALKPGNNQIREQVQFPVFHIFQLASSIILIIVSTVILEQTRFITNKPIGLDKNVIEVKIPTNHKNELRAFREDLLASTSISQVSIADGSPFNWYALRDLKFKGNGIRKDFKFNQLSGDQFFISALGIKIIDGDGFSASTVENKKKLLINESLARLFPGKDIIEKRIVCIDQSSNKEIEMTIVGVVKDFQYSNIKTLIEPAVIFYDATGYHLLVKPSENKIAEANLVIASLWKKYVPDYPLETETLGDQFEQLHRENQNFLKLITACCFISIFLSMIGLFAISYRNSQYRNKEIGIRKVSGAKVYEILLNLNIVFVNWIAISFVIACPVAWYLTHKWLENFAYKTALSWWIFAFAGLLTLVIVLLTVSWQSWKAATRNPVEALRYE